ncbi:hypothetical protein AK812_SmicGene10006 [Symbiodinium microadriaticum]|uniref:Fe2OG dioxygenase domain-containing protein n=1 Tax=Symbiodinium microadriaticum TaxID=2951 RepID=A0A1Q9EGT3_SYMMI|nr:hypothetical protein AK812_SmicGene10006 [Symbiodinium microadriaticum]
MLRSLSLLCCGADGLWFADVTLDMQLEAQGWPKQGGTTFFSMPPLRKKQRYSLPSSDRHCHGSDYAVAEETEPESDSEDAVYQGVSRADSSKPGGITTLLVNGIFMVGAQPPTSYELDLRYEYSQQQVYLLRNVRVGDLQVPNLCKAEAMAFGMISCGQATWAQIRRLLEFLPTDARERWPQNDPKPQPNSELCAHTDSKRFTVGAWNFGNMAGVVNNTTAYPWVTRALAGILRTWSEELRFTSCTLSLNTQAALHRDSRNLASSVNLALPCSEFRGGQLFIEDSQGGTSLTSKGPVGHLVSTNEATVFSPKLLHATLPWEGTRLLLLSFHIGQYVREYRTEMACASRYEAGLNPDILPVWLIRNTHQADALCEFNLAGADFQPAPTWLPARRTGLVWFDLAAKPTVKAELKKGGSVYAPKCHVNAGLTQAKDKKRLQRYRGY